MARQLRILYSGAWYHVMNRGANHQAIFFRDYHRKIFTDLLQHISIVYKVEVHAYCLMTNHYHLLLRTTDPNLPEAMRYLDSVYTSRLNKDLLRDGPLFRGRYKSVLVEADEYLLHVSRYIHLNPLEAGLVKDLKQYRWSSYRCYIGDDKSPDWLHTDFIHEYFTGDCHNVQYKKYTEIGNSDIIKEFYSAEKTKPVLATEHFISSLKVSSDISTEITVIERMAVKWSISEILNVVKKVTGHTNEAILQSTRGKINIPRSLFIYLSRKIAGHKLKSIAKTLSNCHYSTVSLTLANFEKNLAKNNHLNSLISICIMELNAASSVTEEWIILH